MVFKELKKMVLNMFVKAKLGEDMETRKYFESFLKLSLYSGFSI